MSAFGERYVKRCVVVIENNDGSLVVMEHQMATVEVEQTFSPGPMSTFGAYAWMREPDHVDTIITKIESRQMRMQYATCWEDINPEWHDEPAAIEPPRDELTVVTMTPLPEDCPECEGATTVRYPEWEDWDRQRVITCPRCKGTGVMS